jgi:glyoxylase-like metal-dependent hydrolase (beta-lactamase superfamily II)
MIPFVRDFDFAYGRRDQASPLIQRVVADNPGPFTGAGTGTYIVGGSEPGASVAVIDPGPADDAHLAALLDAVDGRAVTHILVTHTHRDHAPLARHLAAATGATIFAARPPARTQHLSGGSDEDDDSDFQPDIVLNDGEIIVGDGWTIEAVFTPGHASNHVAFALREENALFSGDHVMGWSTTVVAPPDGSMRDYMASLDKVIARNFDTIWPTHGPPIRNVQPFLEAYRAHRLEREAQIIGQLRAGDRTITQMVGVLYAAVDRKLWPAASLSMLAHLTKLVEEGIVTATPSPMLSAEFRLV